MNYLYELFVAVKNKRRQEESFCQSAPWLKQIILVWVLSEIKSTCQGNYVRGMLLNNVTEYPNHDNLFQLFRKWGTEGNIWAYERRGNRVVEILHNDELNDLYFSLNIVGVIESRKIRWVGQVPCMGRVEVYTGCWWGNLRERDHLGYPGVHGRIILRWIFMK
jgi:hypothetical protein